MCCDLSRRPNPRPRFAALLFLGLLLTASAGHGDDAEPFQVEVNILSATVKAGAAPIATVPRGTKLVAHEFNGDYYLIDLPGANPPRQGWIAKDDVHRVVNELADLLQRIAALPADQQEDAKKQAIAAAKNRDALDAKVVELLHKGQADEALRTAQQLALVTKNLLGENNESYAYAMNILALAEEGVADFATARDDLAVALSIYRGLYGQKHDLVATVLNNLGDVAFHAGDYPTARKYHEQALAIRREVFGEKNAAVALSLQNLGCLATQAGDYAEARALFEKTLAINREVLGEKHPTTAISLDNLGMVAAETGDFATAVADYNQALDIQYDALGIVHADTTATLNGMGRLAERMSQYPLATKYFTLALSNERQLHGDKHPAVARALHSLGVVAENTGDHQAARKYFEQALAIRRDVLGDKHPETADTRSSLGGVAGALGDFKTALQYYKQALDGYRQSCGDVHPHVASLRVKIADAEAVLGDWAGATESMQQARRIARRYVARTLSGLSQKDQLTFLQLAGYGEFYSALSLGIARHDDPRLVAASADWLLNGKAVAEQALSERTRLFRDASNPAAAQLAGQLISVRSRLATLSLQSPSATQRDAWQAELAALTTQEEELSRQFAALGIDSRQADPWISIDDVRRKLLDSSVLVDFARLPLRNYHAHTIGTDAWQDDHYVAWLTPPTGKGEIEIVDLGAAAPIEAAVRKVRASIQSARGTFGLKGLELADADMDAGAGWQTSLKALAALIWQPLEPRLKEFHEVILSPDAALWLLPWGALPSDDGRHFAIERWQMRYVTSARDITLSDENAIVGSGAVVFADPDYNLEPQATLANTAEILRGLKQPASGLTQATIGELTQNSGNVRSSALLDAAPRLPGTAKEASVIRPALVKYVGEEPQMFLDKRALEGVVKKLKRPRVLVLSTHGFFFPDQQAKVENHADGNDDHSTTALDANNKPIENPLLRCGLLLAGCNHRDQLAAAGADDGVLTGLEIVGCDLRGTELVVLSACDTGLGDIQNGEGVAGLRQAFQLAGARAVVASLWQVPDAETSQLMSDFFANLSAGQSKADSLRNAQLKAIRGRRERVGAAQPFFWAAFTLTGQ